MKCHLLIDTFIDNRLHQIPEDLQETYPSVICVTLGDEEHYFPSQFSWDISVLPHELDQLTVEWRRSEERHSTVIQDGRMMVVEGWDWGGIGKGGPYFPGIPPSSISVSARPAGACGPLSYSSSDDGLFPPPPPLPWLRIRFGMGDVSEDWPPQRGESSRW